MKILIENLKKSYDVITAVDNLNLSFDSGKLTSILGPSGCGKSTLLFMISGLLTPTCGNIFFNDENVIDLETEKRNIGMVFQNYSLYPHMTVKENILFPLKIKKLSKKLQEEKLERLLTFLRLGDYLKRKPKELSGGQQQRVAIGRALIKDPSILLMDEPFSNLDAKLRVDMRYEIKELQKEIGITTIFVTHDQEEALSISDKVLLMDSGKLVQYSTPLELYNLPKNTTAARFVGNPTINLIDGKILEDIFISSSFSFKIKNLTEKNLGKVSIGIRSENFILSPTGVIKGNILDTKLLGKESLIKLKTDSQIINLLLPNSLIPSKSCLSFNPSSFLIYKDNELFGGKSYEMEI